MLAATPTWVSDATQWLGLLAAVAVVTGIGWKIARPGFLAAIRAEIDKAIHPLRQELNDHRRETDARATETQVQLERLAAAGEQIAASTDRRLTDLEVTVESHIGTPNAHGLPRVPQ